MTQPAPPFDDLERGHVVLAPDPFKPEDDTTRPWVVVNNEHHPFDKQQYVAMGPTTQTWYDERDPSARTITVIAMPRERVRSSRTRSRLSRQR